MREETEFPSLECYETCRQHASSDCFCLKFTWEDTSFCANAKPFVCGQYEAMRGWASCDTSLGIQNE